MRAGRFRTCPLLSWDVPEHIFPREWPAPTVDQVLLGRILFHLSCWCYMWLLYQILPLLTRPREQVFQKQQGDEMIWVSEPSIVNILSLIPSSKVPAGQIKQSPHFAAALCLGKNPGSGALDSNCPPMSQICAVNPGPGIEEDKEPQPCFVPTTSWLKHPILLTHTHTKQTQNKSKANKQLLLNYWLNHLDVLLMLFFKMLLVLNQFDVF